MTYQRPRGMFARTLLEKVNTDRFIENYDMSKWYSLTKTVPEKFHSKFILFQQPDDSTLAWLDKTKKISTFFWLQIWHIIARLFLGFFLTQTDINGILRRGSMFILSESQFSQLLIAGGFNPNNFKSNTMIDYLDIGAGDGEVTVRLARSIIQTGKNILLKVYTTETSWIMKDRLQEKQFTVIQEIRAVNNIHLISCLNVLDRCHDPFQMLIDIYETLEPSSGRALLALVLPYSHYVEKNDTHMPVRSLMPHWPTQRLPFESEVVVFFEQLEQIGFNIEAWTKAPYLCEGDLRQSFYWLIDVVVVVSRKPNHR